MKLGRWTAATVTLALAACGGGGAGSGGPVGVITGPTPTPSPTASPAPTPAPSPTASYPTFAQLSGNQTFQTACAALNLSAGSPPAPNPATRYGDGLVLSYNAAADSYVVTNDGLNISFGPADLDPSNTVSGGRTYVRTYNGFTQRLSLGVPMPGGVGLDYVRDFSLRALRNGQAVQYSCVLGVPTLLTDPPAAGTVTFTRTNFAGTAYVQPTGGGLQSYALVNGASPTTVSVNVTTGEATVSVHLIGALITSSGVSSTTADLGTFTGVGLFDDTRQTVYGQLSSSDRQSQFSFFGGWFFGPQGKEAAFATEILAVDPSTGARMSVLANLTAAR